MKRIISFLVAFCALSSMSLSGAQRTVGRMPTAPCCERQGHDLAERSPVSVSLEMLERGEVKRLFKSKRLAQRYDVACVTLTNHSEEVFVFDPRSVRPKPVCLGQVFEECRYHPEARGLAWAGAGLLALPLACLAGGETAVNVAAGVLALGACADTWTSEAHNGRFFGRMADLALGPTEIFPGETVEGFLFFSRLHPEERVDIGLWRPQTLYY